MTVAAACGAAIRLEADDKGRVAVAYLVRGLAHGALGEPDEALADMTRSIETEPRFAPAYAARADLLANRGEDERARADLDVALRLDPRDAESWHRRGNLQDNLGDPDAAIADYGEAIKLRPRADYYTDRGIVHGKQRRYDAALADFDRALLYEPNNARAHSSRGRTRFEMGEFAAAVPDLAKAADREPEDLYYAIWLYLARARAGEADAAAELERRAAAITDDGWPRRIVEMLLGKRGPDALLPSSTGDERRRSQFLCDAGFYAGQYHLLRGDARKARSAFESAVATGAVNQITFQKAEAELRRLAG